MISNVVWERKKMPERRIKFIYDHCKLLLDFNFENEDMCASE